MMQKEDISQNLIATTGGAQVVPASGAGTGKYQPPVLSKDVQHSRINLVGKHH